MICFIAGSKSGGQTPGPLEGVGDQSFNLRTDSILKLILEFLDQPENDGMDLLTFLCKLGKRETLNYFSR